MTPDNLIGLIVGGVAFGAGIVIFIKADSFTSFVKAVTGRIYGQGRTAKQLVRPGLVRFVAGAWVVLGFLAVATALLGGFAGRS